MKFCFSHVDFAYFFIGLFLDFTTVAANVNEIFYIYTFILVYRDYYFCMLPC